MVTIKGNTYKLHRTKIGDMLVLLKNNEAVLAIPEFLQEDFIQILTSAGACEAMLNGTLETDLITNKTNENANEIQS